MSNLLSSTDSSSSLNASSVMAFKYIDNLLLFHYALNIVIPFFFDIMITCEIMWGIILNVKLDEKLAIGEALLLYTSTAFATSERVDIRFL